MKVSQVLPIALLLWGVSMLAYFYGVESAAHRWFPYPSLVSSKALVQTMVQRARGRVTFPYLPSKERRTVIVRKPAEIAPGLTLISGVGPQGGLFVKLIDADGKVQHAWDVDFFRLWPDPRHVPAVSRPRSRPGTVVHGMLLSANGDLTFTYDGQGLMQVDLCGRPKWRLPKLTSHSLFRDEAGDLWTVDYDLRTKPNPDLPNLGPPFFENHILKVSPEGRILRSISVTDLLIRNGYEGLLYMPATDDYNTKVKDDTLHLNSVEIFPSRLKSDFFKSGDIMLSMRNINSIIVIDPNTLRIKTIVPGRFVHQHDPHFVDGSTISVFDNNPIGADPQRQSTKIVSYSFKDAGKRVLFEGAPAHPFFSPMMGKQYQLANGDYLLTEAVGGRAIEVNPRGEVLWEYFNQVKPGILGLLSDAQRIPPSFMTEARLKALAASCPRH